MDTPSLDSKSTPPQHRWEAVFTLPSEFTSTLENAVEDEFTVAERKWGVVLNEEKREVVKRNAYQQLEGKVNAMARHRWTLEDETLRVAIQAPGASGRVITYPLAPAEASKLTEAALFAKETWRLDDEPTVDSIPLSTLDETMLTFMEQWLRTAVFYGVGSYVA